MVSGSLPRYLFLVEFEICIRGRNIIADQDYFCKRQVKLKDTYDHPRDLPMMRELSLHPLPTMRLGNLKDKLDLSITTEAVEEVEMELVVTAEDAGVETTVPPPTQTTRSSVDVVEVDVDDKKPTEYYKCNL